MLHCWTVVCRHVSIDQATNNVTLASTVEQIALPSAVVEANDDKLAAGEEVRLALDHELVAWFIRTDLEVEESQRIRIRLHPPEGESIELAEFVARLEGPHLSYRGRVQIGSLPYRGLGRYWYATEIEDDDGWTEVHRVPIHLRAKEAED